MPSSLLDVWESGLVSVAASMPEGCPDLIVTDRVKALPKTFR